MDPSEHLDFLRRRRSRRLFTDRPVDLAALKRCIEAASWAPSGANSQPWEFVLIPTGSHREAVQVMCRKADERFHETAPPWLKEFLKHHDISTDKIYFDSAPWLVAIFSRRNLPYWLPSVWLAISNFLNQLEAEGLHSVTYTPTLGREFNTMLGVDPDWSFQCLLPVGYADPSEVVKPRLRKSVAEITHLYDADGLHPLDS